MNPGPFRERSRSIPWPEVIFMQCRCPVCGGLTQVPSDLLNYLVRCDACGGLLRPIMAPSASGRDKLKAEPAGVGRVREMVSSNAGIAELLSPPTVKRRNRSEPPPVPSAAPAKHELPQVSLSDMAAMAAVSGAAAPRKSASGGRSTGVIMMSVLGAIVVLGGILTLVRLASPKPALATSPGYFVDPTALMEKPEPRREQPKLASAKKSPEHKSVAKAEPRPELAHRAITGPAAPVEPQGVMAPASPADASAGELFPDVK